MTTEPVTELGSGGVLRLSRARVVPLSAPPSSYTAAVERYLTGEENTRLPANPLASPEDIEDLDGRTLHRLRHSALTHDAEDGTSTPMLPARSRHASVRSLERYARPGVDSVARHVAERDPAARRRR
ncbi:site-specific integrase [Streptomyces sp. NPDC003863]